MKVILERPDIKHILELHFGSSFADEDVVIRADPFEVEVRNIPVPPSENDGTPTTTAQVSRPTPAGKAPPAYTPNDDDAALVAQRADADAYVDPPPPGNDETDITSVTGSPLALIQQSRQLEEQLNRERPRTPQRRGGSSQAPTNFQDELE